MAKIFILNHLKMKLRNLFSLNVYRPLFLKISEKKYSHLHTDVIRIRVEDIIGWYSENKLLEITFEGNIKGGDWSGKIMTREEVLKNSDKYRAIVQRYKENKPWIQTDLFAVRYSKSLSRGSRVNGFSDIKLVEEYYEENYDRLFQELKQYGVKPPDPSRNIAPMYIYIDKDGEILYTRDGNHRLYMALVLGIEKIPVKVWTRNKEWQLKKEIILENEGNVDDPLKKYLNHPDIEPYL